MARWFGRRVIAVTRGNSYAAGCVVRLDVESAALASTGAPRRGFHAAMNPNMKVSR
jgi:hypothetical protein